MQTLSSTTCTIYKNHMYTPEFHSYHTVILQSGLDFVALDNEHIVMMGCVLEVGAMEVS